MTSRSLEQAKAMWRQMQPLRAAGYTLMPLTESCIPRDKGWPTRDYSKFGCVQWLTSGGAVGVRLDPCDLVIDVDPRNGGERSYEQLCTDLWPDLEGLEAPKVQTGGGGAHLYLRKPISRRTRVTLPDHPGIDFKRHVGYVVAPGSLHARTGNPYQFVPGSAPPSATPNAPQVLLDLLQEPEHTPRARGENGAISAEELGVLLEVIDPRDYGTGKYDAWIAISAACHDATDGVGIERWMEWCWRDPDYESVESELLEKKWDSFRAGKQGGVSYRTLFKAVSAAGRGNLLGKLAMAADEFLHEDEIYAVHGLDEEDS